MQSRRKYWLIKENPATKYIHYISGRDLWRAKRAVSGACIGTKTNQKVFYYDLFNGQECAGRSVGNVEIQEITRNGYVLDVVQISHSQKVRRWDASKDALEDAQLGLAAIGTDRTFENRVVLLGKRKKGENTSGDSKVMVYQRMAAAIFPNCTARMLLQWGTE
ncbi:hypothetical protein BDR07DRAFT_1379535 [Suillus spraguei]|nr:hypothetical protein BDR07DRAFT_1379535 [Suillus spraguei]